jgi:putative ABC transport system permease protein
VAVEVALATALLVGATLLIRTLGRLEEVDPGFGTEGVVLAPLSIGGEDGSPYATGEARRTFFEQLEERLQDMPGVSTVGLAVVPPLSFSPNGQFARDDQPIVRGSGPSAHYRLVGGDYFRALGIPLLRGRTFTNLDGPGTPHVAVINASMARLFGTVDPIGRSINMSNMDGHPEWATIVGIVGDIRHYGAGRPPVPEAYFSYRQRPRRTFSMSVVARLPEDETGVAGFRSRLQEAVRQIDAGIPIEVELLATRTARNLAPARFRAWILGGFAAVALLLAAIGVSGTAAYAVERRTREIGIRMALGADHRAVQRHVIADGLAPVGAGLVIGLLAALPAARLVRSLLYDVTPADPVAFTTAALALGGTALAATWWPARRATRVDPVATMRGE